MSYKVPQNKEGMAVNEYKNSFLPYVKYTYF